MHHTLGCDETECRLWAQPGPSQPLLGTATPETLTVGGAEVLLDSDKDRRFMGARATDDSAHILSRVSWGHLEQSQP